MSIAKPFVAWECWNTRCDRARQAGAQIRLTAEDVVLDALGTPHCPGCRLPVIGTHRTDRMRLARASAMVGGAVLGGSVLGIPGAMVGATLGFGLGAIINTAMSNHSTS